MRWLIWILLLSALATGLTLLAQMNTGYVLVALPGRRIELSLNFALVLALSGLAALYLLVRLLVTMIELPGCVKRLRETRRVKKAHDTLIEALQDYFAGSYGRAENAANRAMELGAPVHVGAVIAARAAHELRASAAMRILPGSPLIRPNRMRRKRSARRGFCSMNGAPRKRLRLWPPCRKSTPQRCGLNCAPGSAPGSGSLCRH
mgnify:CR=1 FL=1